MRKLLPFLAVCLLLVAGRTWKTNGPASQQTQASIAFVEVTAESVSAANADLTLNAPASPQIDDIWVAVVGSGDQATNSLSGWTTIQETGSGSSVGAWWFRYNGSTPNLVVTGAGASGNSRSGAIAVFRNCKRTGSPVNVTGSAGQSLSADATIEISGVTPTTTKCLLIAVDAANDSDARSPIPSGFTTIFEDSTGGTQNCFLSSAGSTTDASVSMFYKEHTSGATGDFTDTQATLNSTSWASFMFALEPQ